MFLHFAWNNDSVFPARPARRPHGHERLAVNEIHQGVGGGRPHRDHSPGQGKTNLYKVNFVVKGKRKPASTEILTSIYRSLEFGLPETGVRPVEVFYIYTQLRILRLIILSNRDTFIKEREGQRPALGSAASGVGPAVIRVCGHPSLDPAFRVRRGKRLIWLNDKSRASGYPPTPSEFRCHVGMAPTSAAGSVPGHAAARFALRSPAAA